jgi:hypothetical protein
MSLFHVATSSVTEGKLAVEELATYEGEQSKALLLQIALNPETPIDNSITAVGALRKHPDELVSEQLSTLLQPHVSLALRHATSKALVEMPCPRSCTRSVLHYLERMWRGEMNIEDDLDVGQATTVSLREEQEEVLGELLEVLKRHPEETVAELAGIYGLGSYFPSEFSLYIIRRVNLSQACAPLAKSRNGIIMRDRVARGESRRAAIDALFQELRCAQVHPSAER